MKKSFISSILMVLVFAWGSAFADVLIITNKDVPEDTLTQQEIRDIFLGKRVQWSDNSRIRFAALDSPQLHNMFLELYVRLSEPDWKTYWKRMVFTGRGLPPETVPTEADMIEFVSKTKGAVGYISSEGIREKDAVKIVEIR